MGSSRPSRPEPGEAAEEGGSDSHGAAAPAGWVPPGVALLVSAFGDDGRGGIVAVQGDTVDWVDVTPTTGLFVADGIASRLLRATATYDSVAELLVYDRMGVREYRRLDGVSDPHDVASIDGGWLIVSSAQNIVHELRRDGELRTRWQGSTVADSWHPNCLAIVDGEPWVTAFGRFDRTGAWTDASADGAGFLRNLATGVELGGLTHPHSPRRVGDTWWVCESRDHRIVQLDARDGTRLGEVQLNGYTRGVAIGGDLLFVGESAARGSDPGSDASVAVVSASARRVVGRIPIDAREVYDVVLAPLDLLAGLRRGFDTNLERVALRRASESVERGGDDVDDAQPLGLPLDADSCRVKVNFEPDGDWSVGESRTVTVSVLNEGDVALATVPPCPVSVSSRWRASSVQIDGARAPLGEVLQPHATASIDLTLTAPTEPGDYLLSVSLVQEGVRWFDDVTPSNGTHVNAVVRARR